jgi:hypothetical protein
MAKTEEARAEERKEGDKDPDLERHEIRTKEEPAAEEERGPRADDDFDDRPVQRHRVQSRFVDDEDDDYDEAPRRTRRARRRDERGINETMLDEATDLSRAFVVGWLSQLRLMADVTGRFAETVIDGAVRPRPRRRAEGRRDAEGRRGRDERWDAEMADVAEDFVDATLDAVDDVTEMPRRVVEDFYDAYDRNGERRRARRRARA